MHHARLMRVDDAIEEDVVLTVGDRTLTVFAAVCPYRIEVGGAYPVRFFPGSPDEVEVRQAPVEALDGIRRVGDGYGYSLVGRLQDGRLVVDDLALVDCSEVAFPAHLDGTRIGLSIGRLDVEFLPQD